MAFRFSQAVGQGCGTTIVGLNNGLHIHRDDLALLDDDLAIDDGVVGLLRRAEDDCCDRIMQGSGIADGVKIQREEVGAFACFKRADIGSAKHTGSAERGHFESFASRHPFLLTDGMRLRKKEVFARSFRRQESKTKPCQKHGLTDFEQHVGGVVTGRAIDTESDLHASGHVFLQRRDTRAEPHV